MFSCNLRASLNFPQIKQWCVEAGNGIEISYIDKMARIEPTKLDESNIFWGAFKSVLVDDLYKL